MQTETFTLGPELTHEQRHFLDQNGFIKYGNFLSDADIALILEELAQVEARWIAEGRTKVRGIPIKYGKTPEGATYINRYAFASLYSEKLHALFTSDRFEPVRKILGPQFRFGEDEKDGLVVNNYVNLGGSKYKRLGWHTDGLRDIFLGQTQRPLWQVGLYLDDSPRAKGGLRVIPGTHKQGLAGQLFGKKHFIDHDTDPREICIEARRGDLTIHDGRLWHRVARAEVSGEASRRRVVYMPFVEGPRHPKTDKSRTPLYHYLQWVTGL